MKRFWLVVPLDAPERPGATAQRIGGQQVNNLEFAVGERARRDHRAAPQQMEAAPQEPQGFGYVPDPAVMKKITHFFTDRESAERQAQELAGKNPKTLWGVFECVGSYETTTPQVIHKTFNQDGELVIQS